MVWVRVGSNRAQWNEGAGPHSSAVKAQAGAERAVLSRAVSAWLE